MKPKQLLFLMVATCAATIVVLVIFKAPPKTEPLPVKPQTETKDAGPQPTARSDVLARQDPHPLAADVFQEGAVRFAIKMDGDIGRTFWLDAFRFAVTPITVG